jgi:uncharacterized pyridoxamine 5'-phosphate oxidase family protein
LRRVYIICGRDADEMLQTYVGAEVSMPSKRKNGLQVRVAGNVAFVSTTDVRTNLSKIFNEVLQKYETVVIEKNGKPVGVLKRPGTAGNVVKLEEF